MVASWCSRGNSALLVRDESGLSPATALQRTRISGGIIRRIDGAEAPFIADAQGIEDQFPLILEGGICITCIF